MGRKKSVSEEVSAALDRPEPHRQFSLNAADALSTGSTLLNLELSGMIEGGFFPKRYYRFVGKSGSAKTFLTLTAFAEACRNKRYAKHRLIHDNPEDGALMNLSDYFGKAVNERLEPPAGTRNKPVFSRTVEDYFYHIEKLFKKGDPFIAILDSMDALSAKADLEKKKEVYKAKETGKEVTGSYGTAKAKVNASGFVDMEAALRDSDSIIIIISHAKVNIGPDAMFRPNTFSGGLALKYFAHGEMWTTVGNSIMKTVNGKPRKLGINVRIKIEKNRQTGNEGQVIELPVLKSIGIDDISSCVNYLIEEKHWKMKEGKVQAEEFSDEPLTQSRLIKMIEHHKLKPELREIVSEVWHKIDDEVRSGRQKPYEDE